MGVGSFGKPILIAEHVEPDAKLIETALKRAGVSNPLFHVSDGNRAVCYLKGEGIYSDRRAFPLPGVLMLDLELPDIGGFAVLEWCRTQTEFSDLFIVVMSGRRKLADINRAYQLGAKTFLAKPASEADILEMIRFLPGPWQISHRPRSGPGPSA